jgi:transglutaminase-like putative cysteine protease
VEALGKRLLNRVPRIGLLNLQITAGLVAALVVVCIALGEVVRQSAAVDFLPTAMAGIVIAWGLASTRFNGRKALAFVLIAGPLGLFFITAKMGAPLLDTLRSLPVLFWTWVWWLVTGLFPDARAAAPDLTLLVTSWTELSIRTSSLAIRLGTWMMGALQETKIDDPVAIILSWKAAVWLVSAWAAWWVGRRRSILSGLAPALILLASVSQAKGFERGMMWSFLAIALLMVGWTSFENESANWRKKKLEYVEWVGQITQTLILVISLVLVILSMVIPAIDIDKFLDQFRRPVPSGEASGTGKPGVVSGTPRPGTPQADINPRLETVHSIGAGPKLSDTVLMTVATGDLPSMPNEVQGVEPPRYYWRTQVFDIYTGHYWTSSPYHDVYQDAGKDVVTAEEVPPFRLVRQDVEVYADTGGQIIWTGQMVRSDQLLQLVWRSEPNAKRRGDPFGGADLFAALTDANGYHVESLIPEVSVEQLRAAPAAYPDYIKNRYLQLPDSITPRTLALARDLTATALTPYDRIKAIEVYLRATYPYSLEVPAPPGDVDAVDYFLFTQKTGFCDNYATAMVVLARAAGVPARYVRGYSTGLYDRERAIYIIQENHSHAWPEVYFPGIGWVEFEPTAGEPELIRPGESSSDIIPTLPQAPKPKSMVWMQIRQFLANAGVALRLPVVLVLVALLVWEIIRSWLIPRIDPYRSVSWTFHRANRLGLMVSGEWLEGETPHEMAGRVAAHLNRLGKWFQKGEQEIFAIIAAYTKITYSYHPLGKKEAAQVSASWSRLRWRLWAAWIVGKFKREPNGT